MADEEINQENQPEENQEEQTVDQEELAKQWEEQLAQQSAEETPDVDEILEGQETVEETSQEEKSEETVDQDELARQWEEALAQQQSTEGVEETVSQEDLAKQWEEALNQQESSSTASQSLSVGDDKLDLILDIPLEISVEVGSKSIPLEDILKMTPNTIVELERYIDQPVDIKVNGKLIAKGELYTVENNFGVRITSIITVQERMKLLMEDVE